MKKELRACWANCGALDDERLLKDNEVSAIDALEDSLGQLNDDITGIRGLITRFEYCYHEADKEVEMIISAIAAGKPPVESDERPPERKRDLQNTLTILSAWCEGDVSQCTDLDVSGIPAAELLGFLGEVTPVKVWQVQRIIDQVKWALDRSYSYHVMALDMEELGLPVDVKPEEYYKDHLDFLNQTTTTMLHYMLGGKDSEMSLALAIDLHSPCNWNYANNLVVLLEAINGKLKADRVFAPCSFNAALTPLRGRLNTLSNTLKAFCEDAPPQDDIDDTMLNLLGEKTDVKHWLAASLDKTIRLQRDIEVVVD